MEQPANQPNETPTPPVTRAGSAYKNILIGLFIGILVGIAGLLYYQGHLTQIMRALYTATWVVFGVVILTFIIFWGLREYVTRYIFGAKTAGARDVLDEAQQASDLLTGSLADRLLTDVPAEQRERIKYLLPRLANWLLWGRLRNWWWQWILGIFVSLGGITGTMLLMNQNELLQNQNGLLNNQNTLIKHQMSLEEAGRRSALVVLMSNIMDKVDREIEEQKRANPRDSLFSLSQSLIGQIAALSHSFKPYRYLVEGDTLILEPLSPERGQLLITLSMLPLDTLTLFQIYDASTFSNSDLKEAVLIGAVLVGANLVGANLVGANLTWADLRGADLRGADLSHADLRGANLSDADLTLADLILAYLSGANFQRASLKGADLIGAYLIETNLKDADLAFSDLRGADLKDVSLSLGQAEDVESLEGCQNLHDSIKTSLLKTRSHLFEDPFKENK